MNYDDPISAVKGVGAKTEELFQKIRVYTVRDILFFFPRDYKTMPEPVRIKDLKENAPCAVLARATKTPVTRRGRRMPVTTGAATDGRDTIDLVWFSMPYVKSMVTPGKNQVFYGRAVRRNGRLSLEQPTVYDLDSYRALTGRLLPVYSVTKGLTNHTIEKTVGKLLPEESIFPAEIYPEKLRERNDLIRQSDALRAIHAPADMDGLIAARRRLAFDEFFFFLLSMQKLKTQEQREANPFTFSDAGWLTTLKEKLPYPLTGAQERTLQEAITDMESPYLMQRLIQGDVGSGKTILAFLLMVWCSKSGFQSAIMAPTEVLAKQHYETFQANMELFGLSFPVILLTGAMSAKEKRQARERMQNEPDALIVGTHALIQESSEFLDLALVITDEQHRFGVKQREALSQKGGRPHILVMSATPIPRTLAIILYGDLSISVINELPAKRLPIKNCVVGVNYRPTAYQFIQKEVQAGRQAYVICPLVEASEETDAENVIDYTERLREAFAPSVRVTYLHGRMKGTEKDAIMEAFLRREIDVLVSTTVIEVGVNVPNATVMLVENAERFGLAQLHQLRGRVGRGDQQSYCIFVNGNEADKKNERLDILNRSNDGFFIASEDLKLRGPGDFLGIRQSGILDFKLADVYQDAPLLSLASEEVKRLLEKDPELAFEAHRGIKRELERYVTVQLERLNL